MNTFFCKTKIVGPIFCMLAALLTCLYTRTRTTQMRKTHPPQVVLSPVALNTALPMRVRKKAVPVTTLKLALFTTMSCDKYKQTQIVAVRSWCSAVTTCDVFVFGSCIPAPLRGSARLVRKYDSTFDKMPLFGSMLHETQKITIKGQHDAAIWINADIVLHEDFGTGIQKIFASMSNAGAWMAVVRRFNTPTLLKMHEVRTQPKHKLGGYDMFIWNYPLVSPVRLPYPPFTRTANKWDNWFVTEASSTRTVFDASAVITAQHVLHKPRQYKNVPSEMLYKTWQNINYGGWHNIHNRVVEQIYRRGHSDRMGTPQSVKLVLDKRGKLSVSNALTEIIHLLPNSKHFENFINDIADHRKAVVSSLTDNCVFTGGTGKFFDLILGFACRFKQLHPSTRLIIIAFDTEMFLKAYTHGHETFCIANKLDDANAPESYGTTAYKKITKLKTVSALYVLEQSKINQYVWIDPDVHLIQPVADHLFNLPNDFIVQNNAPTHREKVPVVKLNSGIYKIKNMPWTRQALKAILADSARHTDSEQMSWDRVLCAKTIEHNTACIWNKKTIALLDRQEYATGHELDAATQQVAFGRYTSRLRAWHNNWIKPYEAKHKRADEFNILYFNPTIGICSNH